jgi:hypothetical protein
MGCGVWMTQWISGQLLDYFLFKAIKEQVVIWQDGKNTKKSRFRIEGNVYVSAL